VLLLVKNDAIVFNSIGANNNDRIDDGDGDRDRDRDMIALE